MFLKKHETKNYIENIEPAFLAMAIIACLCYDIYIQSFVLFQIIKSKSCSAAAKFADPSTAVEEGYIAFCYRPQKCDR
jgi:hypothetical protein